MRSERIRRTSRARISKKRKKRVYRKTKKRTRKIKRKRRTKKKMRGGLRWCSSRPKRDTDGPPAQELASTSNARAGQVFYTKHADGFKTVAFYKVKQGQKEPWPPSGTYTDINNDREVVAKQISPHQGEPTAFYAGKRPGDRFGAAVWVYVSVRGDSGGLQAQEDGWIKERNLTMEKPTPGKMRLRPGAASDGA